MTGVACQASGGNPIRERVRARHGNGTRVGNGGRSIRGAPVQALVQAGLVRVWHVISGLTFRQKPMC